MTSPWNLRAGSLAPETKIGTSSSAPVRPGWAPRDPVPSLHRDRALDVLLPALAARGVLSRGRFGARKYEVSNQDHSFAQGVEAVDYLLTGAVEETLYAPEHVNARRPAPRSQTAR